MALREAVRAIRHAVAVSRPELRYVRLTGPDAWDALDRLCAGDLYVRDGQLLQGLLLDEDARPFADCYVGRDDEDYFLLCEGPGAGALEAHLARHLPEGADAAYADLTDAHAIIGLDGPFAWELLAALAGADAIGLPFLTFYHHEDWIVARAGKTGEYGYVLVVPRGSAPAVEERLAAAGPALGAARAGQDALDQCALENWFFSIRHEGRLDVTPLELQLQWRVSPRKAFVGSEALRRRREAGIRRRITTLVGPGPLAAGDTVRLGPAEVGRIVNAGRSEARGDWVALALLDIAWAHPGLAFAVSPAAGGGAVAARSVSPPVINNRSLHVSPQLHSYATRGDVAFPPLERTSP